MADSFPEEKRQTYRVAPKPEEKVRLSVEDAEGSLFQAHLVDVSVRGASATLPHAGAPPLAVGDGVRLHFTAPLFRKPVTVRAKVCFRDDTEAGCLVGFRFGSVVKLPAALHKLFNRRLVHRTQPDPDEPIEVVLIASSGKSPLSQPPTLGRLMDISVQGAGVALGPVDPDLEQPINLFLRLPTGDVLHLLSWIRHRWMQDDTIMYGLEFDFENSADGMRQIEQLRRYVLQYG